MTPVPLSIHLRKAADKELKALLDAGVLEKVTTEHLGSVEAFLWPRRMVLKQAK